MPQTSRERVLSCLRFEKPSRLPRDLWTLPWAEDNYPQEVIDLQVRFPTDFRGPPDVYSPSNRMKGERYGVGTFVDEWGCIFTGIQKGVHGEVKDPILADIGDWRSFQPPYEMFPADVGESREAVNRFCRESDMFVLSPCLARPWERYQFLRGTENAMVDVMMPEVHVHGLIGLIHEFYVKEAEFWSSTDVDGIFFMDDWGAQSRLLIPPPVWRDLFKPLYRDYCEIARGNDKFVFMHSDGYIQEIYPDLVEIGIDAINSQLFCMDMAHLARIAKGRITFWGEIDRQHVLPSRDPEAGRDAVRRVARHLYDPAGGIIAQLELGAGANPAVAGAIFEEWERTHRAAV